MDAKAKVVAKQIRWQDRDCGWGPWLDMGDYDPNGYSGNIPYETRELIPLTDHEAALAEFREALQHAQARADAWRAKFTRSQSDKQTLLTGLEALAGELEKAWSDGYQTGNTHIDDITNNRASAKEECAHELRRTLTNSAKAD